YFILSIVDGLDIIHNLSIVLQDALKGLPVKDIFLNITFITNKLMKDCGFSNSMIELFKQSRLFKDPTILFNLYADYQQTVCDVNLLNNTIYKPWPYLQFNSNISIENLSKYACNMSLENQSKVLNTILKHFIVPNKLQMFYKRGGQHIMNLFNMDEKEIDVFKQVGPIVSDVNELLKRVKRLNQQIDPSQNQDQFAKITNIFCGEVDKPSNLQRQVADEDSFFDQIKDALKETNKSESSRQQTSESIDEDDGVDCSDIRRSIEQSSDVGYIVWPLIKPLLLGKILYAPATPVSAAIIAKNVEAQYKLFCNPILNN
ncbi:unnamed protein product, partial [Rotaria sp. Silwood1]